MSEENMNNRSEENSQAEETAKAQAENFSKQQNQNKPKSKTGIIISSVIIVLIIIAATVYFFITSQASKIAVEIEKSLNTALEEIKADALEGTVVEYTQFKCKGSTEITCKSALFKFSDYEVEINAKNNEFNIKPGIKTAELSINTDIAANIKVGNGSTINQKIKCTDSAELDGSNTYIINKIKCNSEVDKIKSDFEGTIYAKHAEFNDGNFISLIEKFQKDNALLDNTLSSAEYALKDGKYIISSDNLAEDFIDVINKAGLSEPTTLDEVKQEFESAKMLIEMMNGDNGSEDAKFIKEAIDAIDNILEKEHNLIEASANLKDTMEIDDVFFMGFDPALYNIKISSK